MPDWGWIILAVAVVFGASKLPDIARNLGRSSGEFKKGLKEGNEGVATEAEAPPPAGATGAPSSPTTTTPEADERRSETP